MSNKNVFWAIKSANPSIGIYCGTRLTRRDAIADHVRMLQASFGPIRDWSYFRKQGDRAVKVRVTEIEQ